MSRTELITKIDSNTKEIVRMDRELGYPDNSELSMEYLQSQTIEVLETIDSCIEKRKKMLEEMYTYDLVKKIRVMEILLHGSVSQKTYGRELFELEAQYFEIKFDLSTRITQIGGAPDPYTMALCTSYDDLISMYHIYLKNSRLSYYDKEVKRKNEIIGKVRYISYYFNIPCFLHRVLSGEQLEEMAERYVSMMGSFKLDFYDSIEDVDLYLYEEVCWKSHKQKIYQLYVKYEGGGGRNLDVAISKWHADVLKAFYKYVSQVEEDIQIVCIGEYTLEGYDKMRKEVYLNAGDLH